MLCQEQLNKALRANQPVPRVTLGMEMQSADKSNVKVETERFNVQPFKSEPSTFTFEPLHILPHGSENNHPLFTFYFPLSTFQV
mgnify:CR=1 FL=1